MSPSTPRPALPGAFASPDADFIAFQQAIAGRYSLDRELGRGGMGIVYLARELRLARPVAIKVLPRALAASRPELRERFMREAQMAAQLSHPNIVPIHHVDESGEFVFFVMAYIDGETLGERLRRRGAMPGAEAARALREIAWALAYAHVRGIVHRDVKPDNILLERETGRALVTDFGIAGAARTDSRSDDGYIRGTAHFLSPEQATGEPVDGRSDLYSLGVVGYYALTARPPFDAATAAEVMAMHLTHAPLPITRIAPAVPRALAEAVERCLEKDPARRWPTGEAFAAAVDTAFEAPKDVPAPLRLWASRAVADHNGRAVLSFYLGSVLFPLVYFAPLSVVVLGLPAAVAGLWLPEAVRVRRMLRAGFSLDDLRAALLSHVARRREELAFEATERTSLSIKALTLAAAAGLGMAAAGFNLAFMARRPGEVPLPSLLLFCAGAGIGVVAGVTVLTDALRLRRPDRWGTRLLKFWQGNWGERFLRIAGVGLPPAAASRMALTQFTEVALGRATDALFAALPKHVRGELKEVPAAVRRLESDAKSLRATLDALDESLAATTRPVTGTSSAAADELRRARELAVERLASTVAALETIRLGLLQLRLGAAPVTSVTEALQAAERVGRDIELAIDADRDVERVLRPPSLSNRDPMPSPV